MKNLIITPFSLRLGSMAARAYGAEQNRANWFRCRATLFNDGLLKCCLDQTIRPECLFLLMDKNDEHLYHDFIEESGGLCRPIFGDTGDARRTVEEIIRSEHPADVAISRIDSDDLVSARYFESINSCIKEARESANALDYVVATNGYLTDLSYIQNRYDPRSPFITHIFEQYDGSKIFDFKSHTAIVKKNHVQCRSAEWIQIIHGSNLQNRFRLKKVSRVTARSWPAGFHRPRISSLVPILRVRGEGENSSAHGFRHDLRIRIQSFRVGVVLLRGIKELERLKRRILRVLRSWGLRARRADSVKYPRG